MTSITETVPPMQLPVATPALFQAAGDVATRLACHRYGKDVRFTDLTFEQRQHCLEDAALAYLHRDPGWHLPALYVAATRGPRDLATLTPPERRLLVQEFDRFLRVYVETLGGAHPERRRRLGLLALADAALWREEE